MAWFPKWLAKATMKVAKKAGKILTSCSIVTVYQASYSIVKLGQALNKYIDVSDTISETIPVINIVVGSSCAKIPFVSANIIQTYQGTNAFKEIGAQIVDISNTSEVQTTLQDQTNFADFVYNELRVRLLSTSQDEKCSHWYFVYHPGIFWYKQFNRRIFKKPLDERFCGYTNCLDIAVIFMLAVRKRLEYDQRSAELTYTTKFHLLIPANRLLFIPEFVEFLEGLGCFVIEGMTYNNKYLVWLNIPEEQNHFLSKIKNWKLPEAS